jgi:hypothetical protein
MSALLAGRHYFRGDDGYEEARRGTVTPDATAAIDTLAAGR